MGPLFGLLLLSIPLCYLSRYVAVQSAASLAKLAELYREAGIER